MENKSSLTSSCPVCLSTGKFSFKARDLFYDRHELYTYFSCSHCGIIYQCPMPSTSQIPTFYPESYPPHSKIQGFPHLRKSWLVVLKHRFRYSHLLMPWMYRLVAPFIALTVHFPFVSFVSDGKGLDVGCGNGEFITTMNSLGWDFTGVDISSTAVKCCRESGLKVYHGNLQDVGFKDKSFDVVTARHLIEHVRDPEGLVREVARILKSGGSFLIQTPNTHALARSLFGINWYLYDVPRHLVLFNPNNLTTLASRYGFWPIYIKTFTKSRAILRSWDYMLARKSKSSENIKMKRWLSRPFVWISMLLHRGDEIFAIYKKS